MSQQPDAPSPWAAPQPQHGDAVAPPPSAHGQPQGAPVPPPPYGAPQGYPPLWAAPVPPRRSLKPWLIGGAGALVLVLAGGGALARLAYDKVSGPGTHKLAPPREFQGLSRSGNEQREQALRDDMAAQLDELTGVRGRFTPVAAVYGTAPHQFAVWGGYGRIPDAARNPDSGLDGVTAGGAGLLGTRRTMDPGPLGGSLRCAPLEVGVRTIGVCAWSDGSTVVMVLDGTGPDGGDLEATAERIRAFRSLAEVDDQ
ncbi:hypothetical protein [Peterkaempfera sp. SMS 1(5)a]|uniref:hypothetical protein n=1 Tax=Peterkaempfera podocarpi TaxID=3232308 RepID=UPI00366E53ED